VLRILMISLKV